MVWSFGSKPTRLRRAISSNFRWNVPTSCFLQACKPASHTAHQAVHHTLRKFPRSRFQALGSKCSQCLFLPTPGRLFCPCAAVMRHLMRQRLLRASRTCIPQRTTVDRHRVFTFLAGESESTIKGGRGQSILAWLLSHPCPVGFKQGQKAYFTSAV